MDFGDPHVRGVFFDVHSMLPREGPGNAASTARALELCGALPESPRVLDIACGPGMQTRDLAGLLAGRASVAIDSFDRFLDEFSGTPGGSGLA